MHGGAGDDLIYGGTGPDFDGGSANVTDSKYLYGDEGHDSIWGSSDLYGQYIKGGSGDDIIRSGDRPINSIIFGNEGDDIIYPADNGNGNGHNGI